MNRKIQLKDLGFKDYKEVWEYQSQLLEEIVATKTENRKNQLQKSTQNHFLFVEHPHVYTLGKSGDLSNLLLNELQLAAKGATFYKINRGGDITYHGPGQIVGYPILDLENFFMKPQLLLEISPIKGLREWILNQHQISMLSILAL